ncbi:MAG: hypothetical protein D6776_02050 [Planctomycetota bacterium]|nr:MAG: hypothetical protein D6776_02050 [Planctomycetota bacterium]
MHDAPHPDDSAPSPNASERLAERTQELERRLRETERLSTIGELAARIAHEIRNPLAGIAGAVQVLARDFPPGSRKAATAREILREVKRLDAFIRELLVFARPVRPVRKPVPFETLLERARSVLDEQPAFRHIAWTVDDRLAGRPLDVDPELCASVLRLLVRNAAQSQARQTEGRIGIVREARPDGGQRICIEDDGPGFPEDPTERERLFEPLHAGRSRGGGLGLAIARKIVQGHGGCIEARNRAGGGGQICIELPPGR